MKQFITIVIALLALVSCKETAKQEPTEPKVLAPAVEDSTEIFAEREKQAAATDFQNIENLYNAGRYKACLDAIVKFRKEHRMAIEERKRCISLYEQANLRWAESEVSRMSAELKKTETEIAATSDHLQGNLLRNKRDTLQARIDANKEIIKITKEKLGNIEMLENLKK